eukprot:4512953-Pyramimonas_sp.AAC.1
MDMLDLQKAVFDPGPSSASSLDHTTTPRMHASATMLHPYARSGPLCDTYSRCGSREYLTVLLLMTAVGHICDARVTQA